jgi:hypothetical protein
MDDANIRFASDEWYEHHRRKIVWFTAWIDGKRVNCGVSMEALADHFGAYYDDPLPAFRANRLRIQALATKLIGDGRVENDGTIIIRNADL